MHSLWQLLTQTVPDASTFWVMITAVATVALILVAYRQLKDLARTSRSDFLYRLKSDFFNERTRQLIFLAEHNLLEFQPDAIPYFKVLGHEEPKVRDRLRELGITERSISTYVLDDALLGPIEDIGVLENLGAVSLYEAYEEFVTYVFICMENKAIQQYLDYSDQDPADDDVYDHARNLYASLMKESPKIRAKKRKRRPRRKTNSNAVGPDTGAAVPGKI